jgi:PAS domain S-box-containing protein
LFDGSVRDVEVSANCVESDHRILHLIIFDVTERKRAQEALKLKILEQQLIFEYMSSAFAYHQIILDQHEYPVDYIFLKINASFEKSTGLTREIIGKKVTEVLPGIDKDDPDFIRIYGQVALTGKATRFDVYVGSLRRWFSIAAYSPQKGYFVTIFDDITDRKRSEEALREAEKNERLFTQRILSVREEERKKLSANLHDEIGVMAVALGAELSVTQAEIERKKCALASQRIKRTREILCREVEVFRKIAYDLRPPNIDIAGFVPVLKEYFAEVMRAHQLSIYFSGSRKECFQGAAAVALYWITQEALTNIIRHAQASCVRVSLRRNDNGWVYTITDDGRGFDMHGVAAEQGNVHLGILGMKERAQAVNACLTLESVPSRGTTLRVILPDSAGKVA